MKEVILALSAGLFLSLMLPGCGKPAIADDKKPSTCTECHCVELSKVEWHPGTLCPAGMLSQGHGVNAQGQTVVGCYKLVQKTTCGQ